MITSTDNKIVKWVRSLQRKRRAREEESLFVIEGSRWAEESLSAGMPIRLAMYSDGLDERGRQVVGEWREQGYEVIEVSEAVLRACSDTQHPAGLLAVLSQPVLQKSDQPALTLLVDQMSDPGNLGTLIRTAHAAAVDRLLLTVGTVDPFNPKVVRGAMGSLLYLPIRRVEVEQLETVLSDSKIWIADPITGVSYDEVDWRQPSTLIIGGEAHGVGPEVSHLSNNRTHIPTSGETESLNAAVAAGIILFEAHRQRSAPQ